MVSCSYVAEEQFDAAAALLSTMRRAGVLVELLPLIKVSRCITGTWFALLLACCLKCAFYQLRCLHCRLSAWYSFLKPVLFLVICALWLGARIKFEFQHILNSCTVVFNVYRAGVALQPVCESFPEKAAVAAAKVLSSPVAPAGKAAAAEAESVEQPAAASAVEPEDPAFFDKPADYIVVPSDSNEAK